MWAGLSHLPTGCNWFCVVQTRARKDNGLKVVSLVGCNWNLWTRHLLERLMWRWWCPEGTRRILRFPNPCYVKWDIAWFLMGSFQNSLSPEEPDNQSNASSPELNNKVHIFFSKALPYLQEPIKAPPHLQKPFTLSPHLSTHFIQSDFWIEIRFNRRFKFARSKEHEKFYFRLFYPIS